MTLKERIGSFSELGKVMLDSLEGTNKDYSSALVNLIDKQSIKNPWFTPENVKMALHAVAEELTAENLYLWTEKYPIPDLQQKPINVGVVMAGNIPIVGFHDFLSVLISGNNIIGKTSSKDPDLIRFISDLLCEINYEFKSKIVLTDGFLKGIDAVIATGSDNSSRYFEYYFGKYPHIIRKNRSSIAIIGGNETEDEFKALGNDVFSYFGLGCRNVSKIFLPEGFDIHKLIICWKEYSVLLNHNKYANNYDYFKAVYLVNREKFKDTGYLLLKESAEISSPVAVMNYEYYSSLSSVYDGLEINKAKIQCIVSKNDIPFGQAQRPHLWDYADGIDTLEFLLKKK